MAYSPRTCSRPVGQQAEPLRGSLVLAKRDDLSEESLEQLDRAGAAQPVLEASDGTLLTVLPEVRVELEAETRRA